MFQYASVKQGEESFMSSSDFIRNYLLMFPQENYNKSTVDNLAAVVDSTGDG